MILLQPPVSTQKKSGPWSHRATKTDRSYTSSSTCEDGTKAALSTTPAVRLGKESQTIIYWRSASRYPNSSTYSDHFCSILSGFMMLASASRTTSCLQAVSSCLGYCVRIPVESLGVNMDAELPQQKRKKSAKRKWS